MTDDSTPRTPQDTDVDDLSEEEVRAVLVRLLRYAVEDTTAGIYTISVHECIGGAFSRDMAIESYKIAEEQS